MIETVQVDDIRLIFGQEGRQDWAKFTFPVTYGLPVKVRWNKYDYDFNLKGNLKKISGRPPAWPNQLEQLKRTEGNDFIYYGIFGYEATYYMINNYYVPFTGVADPPVFNEEPFSEAHIPRALEDFDRFLELAGRAAGRAEDPRAREFLRKISGRNRDFLAGEAGRLHEIIGGRIPVLPPDTLEVDYEVIPLMIMEGCIYRCDFCGFKDDYEFRVREEPDVRRQLYGLKSFYGEDLVNYNSVLLGMNDALAAGADAIEAAATSAYEILDMERSYHHGANLFLFGSADSLAGAGEKLFKFLNNSPFSVYINIGLESPDQATLNHLGKPLKEAAVLEAFRRAGDINSNYGSIRVSCNFVIGRSLPEGHLVSLKKLLSGAPVSSGKDTVYISPLIGDCERMQIRNEFTDLKRVSRPEVFLYLVQCL